MGLVSSMKKGEWLLINDELKITVMEASGSTCRLYIEGDKDKYKVTKPKESDRLQSDPVTV